jgi:ribosome-binding protein aMBF1 (putative translation factor)
MSLKTWHMPLISGRPIRGIARWFPALMLGDLQRLVGRNLLARRQAQGLSQEDFADAIGVHRSYLGDVERGKRNISLRRLERIAIELDIDARSLLDESP